MDGKGGIMMCKLKGQMDKGHYDVQIMMCKCKLKGQMEHYDVRWMKKVAI